jgi:hypothetical protein
MELVSPSAALPHFAASVLILLMLDLLLDALHQLIVVVLPSFLFKMLTNCMDH